MKEIIKKPIFMFISGIVLATSVTTVALSVVASDVEYDNTQSGSTATTMQGAIDDLYDKANNLPKGQKVVTLGSGTSYNIKNLYPDIDYTTLTTANFYYRMSTYTSGRQWFNSNNSANNVVMKYTAPSISYNASTGVLSCGNGAISVTGYYSIGSTGEDYNWGTKSATLTTTCYMAYEE